MHNKSGNPHLSRRHIVPAEVGLRAIGHFGFFRPQSAALWPEIVAWLEQTVSSAQGCCVDLHLSGE
jgi:predicted alpha/beta hydrolase